MDVTGTVRLSSSSVLIGSDSTSVEARETMKNPRTVSHLASKNPNEEKYHIYLAQYYLPSANTLDYKDAQLVYYTAKKMEV